MFKRTVDIALAAFLLVLSLPLLALAAILIRMDSDGPVIFRQTRMGRGFKRFQLFKLRTMRDGCGGTAFTVSEDPRLTRVGRWLRRYKIDELPQLWNVLRGEMSLVGPRPVMPGIALAFETDYASLLEVRPGLTDPASIKYCNEGEILARAPNARQYFDRCVTPDKIRISQTYLLKANLWRDMILVVQTVFALAVPAVRRRFNRDIPRPLTAPIKVIMLPHRVRARRAPLAPELLPRPELFEVPAAVIEMSRQSTALAKHQSLTR